MYLEKANSDSAKGWYFGPWNSDLKISIGYANQGVNEPHLHTHVHEIYLIARGEAVVQVEHTTVQLLPGDALVLAPGEAHTFISSSADYFHFVVHSPGLAGEAARQEKQMVDRSRLGL